MFEAFRNEKQNVSLLTSKMYFRYKKITKLVQFIQFNGNLI